jgi:O-antigen/teichoic acid export membrane protein
MTLQSSSNSSSAWWYTIGSNVSNALNYINSIAIGRILGPSGIGDFGVFGAYIGLYTTPIAIISTFITHTAVTPHRSNMLFQLLRRYQALLWGCFAISFIASYLSRNLLSVYTVLSPLSASLLIPTIVLNAFTMPALAALLAREKYKANTLITLTGTGVKVSAIPLIALSLWKSTDASITFLFLGSIITALIISHYIRTQVYIDTLSNKTLTLSRITRFAHKQKILYTFFGSASMILIANVDTILARHTLDAHAAGIYTTWSLLSKMVFFTLGPLLTISFVRESKRHTAGDQKSDTSTLHIIGICLLGLPVFYILYQYIAPVLLQIVFGSKFDQLYPSLGLSGVFGCIVLLLNHLTNMHIARRTLWPLWTGLCISIYAYIASTIHLSLSLFYICSIITAVVASLGLLGASLPYFRQQHIS